MKSEYEVDIERWMSIAKPKYSAQAGTLEKGIRRLDRNLRCGRNATDARSINLCSGVKKGKNARALFTENVRLKLGLPTKSPGLSSGSGAMKVILIGVLETNSGMF